MGPLTRVVRPQPVIIGAFIAALLFVACSHEVTRDRWQDMSAADKALYVRSLQGAERVKDSKGGAGSAYTKRVEDYVALIDAAYAGGDRRAPAVIFTSLADRP